MSTSVALLIALPVFFVLLSAKVPVALCLAVSGSLGIAFLTDFSVAMSSVASIPFSATLVYSLSVVPMFILMGSFVSFSGMMRGLFDVAERATRRLPGGLAVGTIAAAAFMGGISGSSSADAAAIGRVAVPEMASRGYGRAYAAAIVAASNTLAVLIPPSIVLVVFGITTGQPIGPLLLAGIVPGIITGIAYSVLVIAQSPSRVRENARVGGGGSSAERPVVRERSRTIERAGGVIGGVILFVAVIGGLYSGLFTATEAGAVGALTAIVISYLFVVVFKQRGTRWRSVRETTTNSMREAISLTAMVFGLIIGATIFTQFLVLAGVPRTIGSWVLGWDVAPWIVVAAFLLILVPLGMFVDGLSMLLVVAPIAYPIVTELGFSGVWFAIMFVKMIEIGLLTPPVGLNVYVVASVFRDIKAESIFVKVLPFIAAEIVVVVILFVFPDLVTFLPEMSSVQTG